VKAPDTRHLEGGRLCAGACAGTVPHCIWRSPAHSGTAVCGEAMVGDRSIRRLAPEGAPGVPMVVGTLACTTLEHDRHQRCERSGLKQPCGGWIDHETGRSRGCSFVARPDPPTAHSARDPRNGTSLAGHGHDAGPPAKPRWYAMAGRCGASRRRPPHPGTACPWDGVRDTAEVQRP
jgi:hypothetical protein